jgi:hypothetical protein
MASEYDATPVAAPPRPRGLILYMNMIIGCIKNIFHVFILLRLAISVSYEHYKIPTIQQMQILAAPLSAPSGRAASYYAWILFLGISRMFAKCLFASASLWERNISLSKCLAFQNNEFFAAGGRSLAASCGRTASKLNWILF